MRRLLAVLALCLPGLAWATTYYAAPSGGTATDCTDAGANVCTAARAVVTASDGDTVVFAPGTYAASELHATVGYLLITGENLTLTCSGAAGSCILQPSAGSAVSGIRFNSPTTTAMTVTGFKVDTSVAANGISECFYSTDGAAQYTLNWVSNTCSGAVTNYAFRNTANEIALTLTGNTFDSPVSATPAAFLFSATTITIGSITLSGNSAAILNTPTTSGGFNLINVRPAANGITFTSTGNTWNITLGDTASANVVYGYRVKNMLGSTVTNDTMTVTRTNTSALQMVAFSCGSEAAVSSAGCKFDGNTLYHGAANGQGFQIGTDSTGTGDTYATLGTISNNNIYCTVDNTLTHATFYGWSPGGWIYGNFAQNCGYVAISKAQTTGALITGNIGDGCWAYAYYSKGSVGAQFVNNSAAISNTACIPMSAAVDGATDSTGTVWKNNSFIADGAAPTDMFTGAANQTGTFDANNYSGFSTLRWTYLNTAYTGLTDWNAVGAVGTDTASDPGITCTNYARAACWRQRASSALRSAGVYVNPNDRAYLGRPFPASGRAVGAWSIGSGDEATARTARTQ